MATPNRRLVLQNIKTVLETITTGNGYKTTIDTVEALGKSWATVKPGQKPWLGIVPQRESLKFEYSNIRVNLTVLIIGHVTGTTQDDRATKLNNLLDDVIAALNTDTTRSNNAISTTITTVETDEGAPDGDGDGSMVITVDVVYFRGVGSS
tara:strand:+ start:117 stop:569 length:453 start_codon:yes stop_codon:yes gene_type:complete